ncbi:MAG: Fe2+-dependent dioxygenase [Casimicrobiaceae bacterium]
MLVQIPNVLTAGEVTTLRTRIDAASWVDGSTAPAQPAVQMRDHEHLPEDALAAREAGETVHQALARSALFVSVALPARLFPPLFSRVRPGMNARNSVGSALRSHAPTGLRIRADLAGTLFLSDPTQYEGGELMVDDTYGAHSVKFAAGDVVLCPGSSLHRVAAVTRGTRVAALFWVQSLVRDDARRTLLFDLDMAVLRLTRDNLQAPDVSNLTGVYHNLLRMWAEP